MSLGHLLLPQDCVSAVFWHQKNIYAVPYKTRLQDLCGITYFDSVFIHRRIDCFGTHAFQSADTARQFIDRILRRVDRNVDDADTLLPVGQTHSSDNESVILMQQRIDAPGGAAVLHDDRNYGDSGFHMPDPFLNDYRSIIARSA